MRQWLVLVPLVLGVVLGTAQSGVSPLGIVPAPIPGFSVSIWTERPQYTIGEEARIFFYVSQPAYVYIFDIEPSGRVRQLFPNFWSPNPYVPAGVHTLPDRPTYRLKVTPPGGMETLQIVACTSPLGFSPGTPAEPYPLLGPDVDAGRARVLGIVPEPGCGCCVTAWTTVQILPSPGYGFWPCPPCFGIGPCPPCFGVTPAPPGASWFCDPGGTWHFFIGGCPSGPGICWYLGPDGRWQIKVNICFGNCD